MNTQALITYIFTFVTGIFLFRFAIPYALANDLVDVPTSRRRHSHPTPIIGGLVVFTAWFFGIFLFSSINPGWFEKNYQSIFPVLAGLCILLPVGIWDDINGMRPRHKLIFQIIAATIVIKYVPSINQFCTDWETRVGVLSWIAAGVWIVGLSNAINLVDGMDGLAGGISSLVALSLLYLGLKFGEVTDPSSLFMLIFAASILAFMVFNWSPAKIFLGDNGSISIGFLIATSALMGPIESKSWTQVINLLVIVGYPILDMGLASWRRFKTKNPLFRADRNHLHHRFLRFGLSTEQVITIILSITAYFQLTAICMIDFMRSELVKTDLNLFNTGLIYMLSLVLNLFTLLYVLRTIERSRSVQLAKMIIGDIDLSHQNTVENRTKARVEATIDMSPLFESGLFEERSRIKSLVTSLILLLDSTVRKEDCVYEKNDKIIVVFNETLPTEENIKSIEKSIRQRLVQFQEVFKIQYSLADLNVRVKIREFDETDGYGENAA